MNKLLTFCPSRIRPSRVLEMLESWDSTRSPWNDMVIYVADDDPTIEEYKKNLSGRNLVIGPRRTKVQVDNYITTELYPNYEYYAEINDDHIYHTPRWDEILIKEIERHGGWGVACGNMNGLPSGMVMSGNIIKTLGYHTTPLLEQSYGDDYHLELFSELGMFYRVPGVNIEHRHWIFGKAPLDDNYSYVTSEEHMQRGRVRLHEWRNNFKERDINRILNASRSVN